jgi:hypothetical protein
VINLRDIIIIYLACGAPFGVYYFLQHRETGKTAALFLRSCGVMLLWIPYACFIWRKKHAKGISGRANFSSDVEISLLEQRSAIIQKQILQSFVEFAPKAVSDVSFFGFRDVLETYAGLTIAVAADQAEGFTSSAEVFKIAGREKKEMPLGQICLTRRNRNRLYAHQTDAREDMLRELAKLAARQRLIDSERENYKFSAFKGLILELFELLDVKSLHGAKDAFAGDAKEQDSINSNGARQQEIRQCQPQQLPHRPQVQTQ